MSQQIRKAESATPSTEKPSCQGSSRYSIFPEMTATDYESPKASIADHGVEIPVILDEDGNVIDGHHRRKACGELRIACPSIVRKFGSEAEKYELALQLNCSRRQLSTKEKRELVATYLNRDPEIANNHLGTIIGVDSHTVESVRGDLEGTSEIPKLEKLRGRDGKVRRRHKIIANSQAEVSAALRVIQDLPESSAGKTLDITSAKRRAARNCNQRRRADKLSGPIPEGVQIHECSFQDLERIAGIVPASVNAVITDIPYDKGFISQVADLAEFADRVLVEGGTCAVLCGQYWVHKIMEHLSSHLKYRWVIASTWEGAGTPVRLEGSSVVSKWKPILVYSKGSLRVGQFYDALTCAAEKDWHPWQQPLAEVQKLVEFFSAPGDLVVDPCGAVSRPLWPATN